MPYDASAQTWTTAELLADVRRVASLPATSVDFTDAVILREASEVLWSYAGWALQQAGEGRLVETLERPVSAALSSMYRALSEVDLPPLAIADTVESVSFLSADGRNESRLQRIEASVQSEFDQPDSEGTPTAYALVGSRLRLYPRPSQGGVLRIAYQRRHPALITFDPSSTVVTNLTGWGTTTPTSVVGTLGLAGQTVPPWPVGTMVDVLRAQSPYRTLVASASVLAHSSSAITLGIPPALIQNVTASELVIVRAGESPYVHYPLELRASVNEKIAANLMRRVGDMTGAQAAEASAAQELGRVLGMLSSRSKRDRPKAINPWSHLRGGMRRGWRVP